MQLGRLKKEKIRNIIDYISLHAGVELIIWLIFVQRATILWTFSKHIGISCMELFSFWLRRPELAVKSFNLKFVNQFLASTTYLTSPSVQKYFHQWLCIENFKKEMTFIEHIKTASTIRGCFILSKILKNYLFIFTCLYPSHLNRQNDIHKVPTLATP